MKTLAIFSAAVGLVIASAERPSFSTIQPNPAEVAQAAATAVDYDFSQQEKVPGKVFERIAIIWLENTDYDKAEGQPNLKSLAEKGIKLTNYFALTHPSQPNYMASAGGDYFGLNNDDYVEVPAEIQTIADLLDEKRVSWGEYQEDMPYTGFEGFEWLNQENHANDYVRKHNPHVQYNGIADHADRLSHIKNFTLFERDLKNHALPQWMFITPNMTNCGHDTNIGVSGQWSWNFISPLLEDEYFNNNTLVVLTFDENETYEIPNQVYTLLLGDLIPDELRGTEDDTYYDHYSLLATVQANWGLPTLGRHDCGANVFDIVAKEVGYTNKYVDSATVFNNESYSGWFQTGESIDPVNDTCIGAGGHKALVADSAIHLIENEGFWN